MQADRFATAVPVELLVDQSGGVPGLTVVVAVRDATSADSYLDWADMTFKAAGWVARQVALVDIGEGVYRLSAGLDLTALTNLPAATHDLILEYDVTGAITARATEQVTLVQSLYDLWARDLAGLSAPAAGRILDRIRVYLTNRTEVDVANQKLVVFEDDGLTVAQQWDLETALGPPDLVKAPRGTAAKRSDPLEPL